MWAGKSMKSPLHVARALIVLLTLLAYAPAILFGDLQHLNVEDDVHLPRGRPATLGAALRWCAFEAPRLGTAGPLGACLQVAVNWVGASAAAARVASLACHLWVAVSSLGLCYRLGDDAAAAAAAVGLLVAAHPLHAQAVAWARHLPALAAAGFALEAAHKALDGRSAAAAVCALAACLTKATAVGSPALVAFALVAVDRGWTDAEKLRHALRSTAPAAAAALACAVAHRRGHAAASGGAAARLLVFEGWRDALAAAAWYAWSLAAPPDNPPALRYSAFDAAHASFGALARSRQSLAFAAGLTAFLLALVAGDGGVGRVAAAGGFAYACLLAPTVGVAAGAPAYGLVADRYAYLPAAGVAAPLAALAIARARAGRAPPFAKALAAFAAAFALLQARRTAARLGAYAGPLALYTAATSANPGDFESWVALGHATKEDPTKDDNDTDLYRESLRFYNRAVEAGGEKPCGIAEVMTLYLGSNLDAAACWERRAGSDRPAAARLEARVRAAKWRNLAGDTAGAAAHVDAVLAARPHDCGALLELGNARRRRRDGAGAAAAYGAAAACDPTWDAPHLNWGILEIDRENRDAAYGHFRDQLALQPNRGSLRRLKILRDINEGDPTIAKIVADFEARHAEL